MEFTHLTKHNAKDYVGSNIIFKINETPMVSTLCNQLGEHFVINHNGKQRLLSIKHPTFVILDNSKINEPVNNGVSLHYSMNFLPASCTTITQFVGHYAIVRLNGGFSVNKIRSVSKSLKYISIKNGSSEKSIDIVHTPCYVIV